ncbi:MAG: hypothetical protein E7812_11610 [Phenylobacterium sp.]|nr:MAG: hypothetical protein E7812_11610 [Phenylobacterium sp.]
MARDWTPERQIFRHGAEQEPVIVIDDYARDPEQLIEEAAALDYGRGANAFPGVRAPVPPNLMGSIRDSLAGLIRETFGIEDELNRIESYYSLITTPPGALDLLQRLPHFDGVGPQRVAILHHLSRAERGGTAFYRHRSTGFETITEDRLPTYNRVVNAELASLGLPEAGYIGGDTAIYEQIASYEARFNRLLIYRGNTLHSADVPADLPLTADPRTGRFSINTFIWLQA